MSVDVFGMSTCQPCKATKRWLDTKGVSYSYHDISVDEKARQRFEDTGYSSVPVVITDNDMWSGFVPAKMKGLLA